MILTIKDIFIEIFKLLSVILILVFLLSRVKKFKIMIFKSPSKIETIILSVLFGLIGIIGTYGFPLQKGIANTRAVGVIVAGLVSGPAVGLGAGIIAGVHRYLLGGLTINGALISVIVQGFLAGKFFEIIKRRVTWYEGLLVGAVLEVLHFLIVLAVTRPFFETFELIKLIASPMIIVNSVGVAFFILMIDTTTEEQRLSADFSPKKDMNRNQEILPVRSDERLIIINQADIFLTRAIGQKKTEIVTTRGNYSVNFTLKELEEKLNLKKFLRTHKSYIINIEKITEVIPWFNNTYLLIMEGCQEKDIPVSRSYIKEFDKIMGIK